MKIVLSSLRWVELYVTSAALGEFFVASAKRLVYIYVHFYINKYIRQTVLLKHLVVLVDGRETQSDTCECDSMRGYIPRTTGYAATCKELKPYTTVYINSQ